MTESTITLKKSFHTYLTRSCSKEDGPTSKLRSEKTGILMQCAKRRLQYSQLPVRCPKRPLIPYQRPVKSGFKISSAAKNLVTAKINTTRSCQENSPCTPRFLLSTPGSKKSLSLIDLTPMADDHETHRSGSNANSARVDDSDKRMDDAFSCGEGTNGIKLWIDDMDKDEREKQNLNRAAKIICHTLIVNAWRRRRSEISILQGTINQLGQQVDHLHLQIVVLRRLLDNENGRVGSLSAELHKGKMQLEEITKERDTLKSEKESSESEVKRLQDLSEERLVTAENLRNELHSTKDQLHSLETQIERDREKLLKLREDKKILLEKIAASEVLVAEKELRATSAESCLEDTQVQLAEQIALTTSSHEEMKRYSSELEIKESEKMNIEERLRCSEDAGRALSVRAANLENQLAEREAALKRVEAAYTLQMLELNELRERILRQSQDVGWSSRVLQLAGTVVRAPRAILRTFFFPRTQSIA